MHEQNVVAAYVVYRREWIFVYGISLIFCLFPLCIFLSDLGNIIYSLILSLTVFGIFSLKDFWHFSQKYRLLYKEGDIEPEEILIFDPLDAAYAERLHMQKIKYEEELAKEAAKYHKMQELYTLWSHQIKTPVAAIGLIADELRELRITEEVFRIDEYIDLLLNLVRLNSPSTDYVFREYKLDELLKKSIRKFSKLFIQKKLALHYISGDQLILTDEKWFCIMIDQILSNALKYTEKGSICIVATAEDITICDTGVGIAPSDLPRVTEPGFTGFNGRREQKSTGMGLYISKTAGRALGIGMEITSEPGRGTKVVLSLPRQKLYGE